MIRSRVRRLGSGFGGDGESDYSTAVLTLCAEGMVMQTLLGQGLHQHLLPALQGPAGWMQALQAQGQERGEITLSVRVENPD